MLGLDQLEADALAVAFQGGPQSSQAFDILISFPELSKTTIDALIRHPPFTDSKAEDIRMGLLARVDPHRYLSDLSVLIAHKEVQEIGSEPLMFNIIANLSSIDDIEALKTLANGPAKAVRFAAIYALRRLRSPKTTSFLVGKLRASDSDEAYEALMGLAESLNRLDLATDMGTFENNRRPFVEKWETWWQDKGAAAER